MGHSFSPLDSTALDGMCKKEPAKDIDIQTMLSGFASSLATDADRAVSKAVTSFPRAPALFALPTVALPSCTLSSSTEDY